MRRPDLVTEVGREVGWEEVRNLPDVLDELQSADDERHV